jgi:glycerol-3-phosphate dehydrogenase subunit C
MNVPHRLPDLCLKCNICTAACPVMPATDLFPGPKATGPQAERYIHPDFPAPDYGVEWCSGCGVCSRVCPHGVPVSEINIRAKARFAGQGRISLRDQLLSRPHLLARLAAPVRPAANWALQSRSVRWLLDRVLSISREAPLPTFAAQTFRQRAERHLRNAPTHADQLEDLVALFHGCSVESYEPAIGMKALEILETLGFQVDVPPQTCCGLPLQSNGLFDAARKQARENIGHLLTYAYAGVPILGTSTSCTLALRHDYSQILDLQDENTLHVAERVRDLFEFLVYDRPDSLVNISLSPIPIRALYHPPCQLKAHGMGTPARHVLERIPELELHISESECCGVAGTYGIKRERYDVARDVGASLMDRIARLQPDIVRSDSETCRWWISHHSGTVALHPLELLHFSLGLEQPDGDPLAQVLAPLTDFSPERRSP